MSHWRLTPDELAKLTNDEITAMIFAFKVQERRQVESLNDTFGILLGASWPIEALIEQDKEDVDDLDPDRFMWKLRPPRLRVNTPVTSTLSPARDFMKGLKETATELANNHGRDQSVMKYPTKSLVGKDEKLEIVDLSKVSKAEFLKIARSLPPA